MAEFHLPHRQAGSNLCVCGEPVDAPIHSVAVVSSQPTIAHARRALDQYRAESAANPERHARPLTGDGSSAWWAGYLACCVEMLLPLVDRTPGGDQ